MKKIFLDVESLPAAESKYEQLRYLFGKKLEKKNKRREMSEEVIVEEPAGQEEAKFEDYIRGTSFDGAFGRVLCIAYAINDGPTEVICHPDNEKATLESFWNLAKDADLFIGHNIFGFDLKFLYQRSVVLGIKPSRELSFAKFRSFPIYDTMHEWSHWTDKSVGLEHVALALGIPTPKEGIDGSQVYDFYQAGKVKEICDYCQRDVATTRAVYKRINFEV